MLIPAINANDREVEFEFMLIDTLQTPTTPTRSCCEGSGGEMTEVTKRDEVM
jgi:hypothetical protein